MTNRIVFDISSLARWVGPATGIVRVQHAFATWARANRPDVVFAFYDPELKAFCTIAPRWLDMLLGWDAMIDTSPLPPLDRDRLGLTYRVPRAFRGPFLWITRARRQAIMALERRRIETTDHRRAARLAHWQDRIFSKGYRRQLYDKGGRRGTIVPYDLAIDRPIELGRNDTLVATGSDWSHLDVSAIGGAKARDGFRYMMLCFDIIPLLFPEFYRPRDVAAFHKHFSAVLPFVDRMLFYSRNVETDFRTYWQGQGLALKDSRVIPLGSDPVPTATAEAPLPPGLERGKYALFVSTIEPRKGHQVLIAAWDRLLKHGVPQRHGFKLVFVGRKGWMVDDVLADLADDRGGTLLWPQQVSDPQLGRLYANCAFCLYPSRYEGYGLPVVEAFGHGKAVLASSGGAIPEVVGDLSPCLDPLDVELWAATMRQWIENPNARHPFEEAIRQRFRRTGWDDAARAFFAALDEP